MKIYKNVRSTVCPEHLFIDEKSVWVAENIKEVELELESESYVEYEFDQTRYSKDEYVALLSNKNAGLEVQVTDTQLALCEIYERMI